jgi:uncharacterized membrane protein YfcA
MAYVLVCGVALFVATLTFFSGFGLGTLLMPAFAVFFPVEVAVAATAVVHLANSLFKLALLGRDAHWPTVLTYGAPALVGAIAGAFALTWVSRLAPLATYHLGGKEHDVTAIRVVIAAVIVAFAVLELWPGFEELSFKPRYVALGGVISGFFGGLSGHQGALRSAFLLRAGLTKRQFIATRAAGAVIVDLSRLVVYGATFMKEDVGTLRDRGGVGLVAAASACAFVGTFVGSRLIEAVTLTGLRRFIGAALLILALALGAGLV